MDQQTNEFCFERFSPFEIVTKSLIFMLGDIKAISSRQLRSADEKQIWETLIFQAQFRKQKRDTWSTFTFFPNEEFQIKCWLVAKLVPQSSL